MRPRTRAHSPARTIRSKAASLRDRRRAPVQESGTGLVADAPETRVDDAQVPHERGTVRDPQLVLGVRSGKEAGRAAAGDAESFAVRPAWIDGGRRRIGVLPVHVGA